MSDDTHYPIYRGVNLSLGAMQRGYVPRIAAGLNDLRVTKGMLVRPPITLEMEYGWYDSSMTSKDGVHEVFAILKHCARTVDSVAYEYIGHMGLHRISWPDATAVSGSIILSLEDHGKGYGTEAKMLLLYHAFRVKGLYKVVSEVKAFNGNSWGHLLKCGYQVVGRHRRQYFHDGNRVDEIRLEVFRDDWEPIWEQYQCTGKLPTLTKKQRALIKKG